MNIFEARPRFEGPAEGGSPRYYPLRLGPKIIGKCSLPCRKKISKFETLQKVEGPFLTKLESSL